MIIIVIIILLVIHMITAFVKVAIFVMCISENHRQKQVLTGFYLSLLNDGKINGDTEKYILMSLFSKTDTGLVKTDSVSEKFPFNYIEKNIK